MADAIIEGFETTFRDFVTDGVPASGKNKVKKKDARKLGITVSTAIQGAAAGNVGPVSSWAQLAAIPPTRNGQPGSVTTADAGTHTDPVVGGTVPNSGMFTGSLSPLGWRRVGNFADVSSKADQSSLDATNAAVALKATQSSLDATNATLAQKANQSALDATNAAVGTKASQAALSSEIAAREALSEEVEDTVLDVQTGNWNRPGEAYRLWTDQPAGAPGSISPIAPSMVHTDSEGDVVRVSGSEAIAPIRATRIEPGRLYRVRFVLRRRENPADPSNHNVRLAVRWLSRGKGAIPAATGIIQDISALTVANGRTEVTAVVARAAGAGVNLVAPAAAVYMRPFVQTYGNDGVTDIEVVDVVDITDAITVPVDVGQFESRVDALESADAAVRLDEIESTIGGAQIRDYLTRGAVAAATISETVDAIRVMQFDLTTPLAPAVFARVAVEPSHSEKIQSADGAWWELSEPVVTPEMVGGRPDTGSPTAAIQRALNTGKRVSISGGIWDISETLHPVVDGQIALGFGKEFATIRNIVNEKPLWSFRKDETSSGYVRRATFGDVTLQGNALTEEGLVLPGILDDDLSGDASKANCVAPIRIIDVGGGPGARISSWCNTVPDIEIWDCKEGLVLGSESNANSLGRVYISGCSERALSAPAGPGVPSCTTIDTLIAQYSATQAGVAVDVAEHYALRVNTMYIEGNGGVANVRISGGAGLSVGVIMANRVSGAENDVVLAEGGCKGANIGGIVLLGGTFKSAVRATGTLPTLTVGPIHLAAGSFSEAAIVDESTRKAIYSTDALAGRQGPTILRSLFSQKALDIRRSDTDATQMFVQDGKLYFGEDTSVPRLERAGGTVSLAYGSTLANLKLASMTLGNTGNVRLLVRSGTPEGANSGDVGSICVRTDGAAGTTLYVKESGTGNTGWVAK